LDEAISNGEINPSLTPQSSPTPCTPSTMAPSSPGPSTAPEASPGGCRSGLTVSSRTTNGRDVRRRGEASGSVDLGLVTRAPR
jgi:hypothetical protein